MSGRVVLGLVLALGAALALNWSYVAQHTVATGLPPLSARRPLYSLRLLFGNLRWLLGMIVGIGGWLRPPGDYSKTQGTVSGTSKEFCGCSGPMRRCDAGTASP